MIARSVVSRCTAAANNTTAGIKVAAATLGRGVQITIGKKGGGLGGGCGGDGGMVGQMVS